VPPGYDDATLNEFGEEQGATTTLGNEPILEEDQNQNRVNATCP